ncbi:MAG: NADH-quinone oxidoreductase subunit G [Anaerolineae bacterium]
MASLSMFINGQEIQAEEGSTILQAAKAAGFDIPTLCHHPALSNWGGCRMCLVEVEPRGLLHPACTYPVSAGLRVQTHSEKVVRARKFVLQWLFSERSHYCMYCAASGDCELQAQAYAHDLDHWLWARPNTPQPVDASRAYFIMDHNRCILCRRCIRACAEMPAVHTLGTAQRGAKTMVVADLRVPFGASSCISCGSCLQACPTGALIDRRSAYMGRDVQLDSTASVCFGCAVGCGIVGRSRSDRVVRIEGDWEAPVNEGLLCRLGRFLPLYVEAQRVTSPMCRVGGSLQPCTWDEALALVAERLAKANGSVAAAVSGRATNEELAAAQAALNGAAVSALDGPALAQAPGAKATLANVATAAAVVLLEAEVAEENEVVACLARRAYDREGKVYILGGQPGSLEDWAVLNGTASQAAEVAATVAAAGSVVVVYGPGASAADLAQFAAIPGVHFLGLPATTNAAAADLGNAVPAQAKVLYLYTADDVTADVPVVAADFVVAHAAYEGEATKAADVVLPALLWAEKQGHLTSLEGRIQEVRRIVPVPAALREDEQVFIALAQLVQRAAESV